MLLTKATYRKWRTFKETAFHGGLLDLKPFKVGIRTLWIYDVAEGSSVKTGVLGKKKSA